MLVDKIILRTGSKFTSYIAEWAKSNCDELLMLSDRHLDLVSMESLLIFNQNQHLTRDIIEYKSVFDKLADGTIEIKLISTDSLGNSGLSVSQFIYKDSKAPVLSIVNDSLVGLKKYVKLVSDEFISNTPTFLRMPLMPNLAPITMWSINLLY